MPKTYNPNLIQDRDRVRFLAHDNVADAMVYEDQEIEWVISQSANVYMAAAQVVEGIIAQRAVSGITTGLVKSKKVGSLEITYDTAAAGGVKFWQDLAASLRKRGSAYIGPWAGGVLIADLPNGDAVPPVFTQGQFDDRSVTTIDEDSRPPDRWPFREQE